MTDQTRRQVLGCLGAIALAGCTTVTNSGSEASPSGTDEPPVTTEVKTDTRTSETQTGTTPENLPDKCPTSPAIDGLPDRPDDPDSESVTSFVRAYERTLTLARHSQYTGFSRFEHVSTDRTDGGYSVYFYVVPQSGTPTPSSQATSPTATPVPEGTDSYNVGYFIADGLIVRDKRPDSLTYQYAPYDGFDPRKEGTLIDC